MMPDHPLAGLEEKLDLLNSALRAVDKELALLSEEDLDSQIEADRVAEALVTLNVFRSNLSETYKVLETATINAMRDFEELSVAGARLEKKTGRSRSRWQHKELGHEVARRLVDLSIDHETGEFLKTSQQIAEEMLQYAAPSYWRIKELNKIGINADQYSNPGELKTSIAVRRTKDYDPEQ